MRPFLAGLAVLLAFLTGTTALAAAVAHRTLLDPTKAGRVVDAALQDDTLRTRILDQAVPGYAELPQVVRSQVDALAATSPTRDAVRRLRLAPDGTVSLAPLQAELAQQLRDAGLKPVAAVVSSRRAAVTVPSRYLTQYQHARHTTDWLQTRGTLATAVLVALALLVSPRRGRTIRSVGLGAVVAAVLVAAAFWVLPGLVRGASSDIQYHAVASAMTGQRPEMWALVVPVGVVGLVLVAVGLLASRRDGD